MERIESLERTDNWWEFVVGLLPLWMMALALTAEGFPHPLVPGPVALALFVGSFALSLGLVLAGWMTPVRALYSLLPLLLLIPLDEISTTYKTPFLLMFAAILSVGALLCQFIRKGPWGELVLLAVAVVAVIAALHAKDNYWSWALGLGFGDCMPDVPPCPPLAGLGMPWWKLFFGF